MDRLQKNCVIASASVHGLLAGTLLFGSAFLAPRDKAPDLGVLDVIPAKLVDEAFSGGGTPNAKLPPPAQPTPPAPQPPPVVTPPAPAPVQAPERRAEPEPEPPKVVKPPAPAPIPRDPSPQKTDEPDLEKPPTRRRLPDVPTTVVRRSSGARSNTSSSDSSTRDRAAAAAAASEARERRLAFDNIVGKIGDIASSSAEVGIPGPGGEAYANYAQIVKSVYTHAWLVPPDVNDDEATTVASVTIARDGTVVDARIIQQSGNAAVDASVRRTLDRVRTIEREFPAGAKEAKRTFTIKFNLKAKRLLG